MTSWHQSQVTTRVLLRMSYPRGPTNGSVCTTWSIGSSNGRSSRASHRRFRWVQVAQAKPFSSNQAVISASGALGEVVIQKQRLLKQNNINLIYILYIHDSIKNLIKLTNKQRVKQTRIDSRSPAMPEPATVWRDTYYNMIQDAFPCDTRSTFDQTRCRTTVPSWRISNGMDGTLSKLQVCLLAQLCRQSPLPKETQIGQSDNPQSVP